MSRTCSVFAFLCMVAYVTGGATVAQVAGDANGDLIVNVGDVVYEVSYLYRNGPPPLLYECGDPTADCIIDVADVVYLVNYLFKEGSDPEMVPCHWSEPVNLGEPINSPAGEESFSMTPEGRMAIWSSSRDGTLGNQDIWYSFWDSASGSWSAPSNCGPSLNTPIDDLEPCLSSDGKTLYYVQFERPGGYGWWDIWVSTWDSVSNEWGVPENAGPAINSSLRSEHGPFVSPDGSALYFNNSLGIWISEWNGSGWGQAALLDTTVNSTQTEHDPGVTADNQTLYFTRAWHTYSIFVSYWTGTAWGTPEILPPHINVLEGAAGQSYITPDGSKLYFTSARPGGLGSSDIWFSERILAPGEPRVMDRVRPPERKLPDR